MNTDSASPGAAVPAGAVSTGGASAWRLGNFPTRLRGGVPTSAGARRSSGPQPSGLAAPPRPSKESLTRDECAPLDCCERAEPSRAESPFDRASVQFSYDTLQQRHKHNLRLKVGHPSISPDIWRCVAVRDRTGLDRRESWFNPISGGNSTQAAPSFPVDCAIGPPRPATPLHIAATWPGRARRVGGAVTRAGGHEVMS